MDCSPPLPDELVQVPVVKETLDHLGKIIERVGTLPCVLRNASGEVSALRIRDPNELSERGLAFSTLLINSKAGGLSGDGLLDGSSASPVSDHADTDVRLRYEETKGDPDIELPPWVSSAVRLRISLHDPDEEEAERRWRVYARERLGEVALNAESDVSRLAIRVQTVEEHDVAVGEAAGRLARALNLPEDIAGAVEAAGAWHDSGKRRVIWQRAAGNRDKPPLAKSTSGVMRPALLGGFRHEFASLVDADRALPVGDDRCLRDLTLHLISAHHGFARPGFSDPRQWDRDLPTSQGARVADEVEQRYARLQAAYGTWTLAWLEALVKCADAWVSAGHTFKGS